MNCSHGGAFELRSDKGRDLVFMWEPRPSGGLRLYPSEVNAWCPDCGAVRMLLRHETWSSVRWMPHLAGGPCIKVDS